MIGYHHFMLYGVIVAEQLIIALIFARFYAATRDRLFLFFTIGFIVMAMHRVSLGYARAHGIELEDQVWFFASRAVSYLFILAGIIDKNLTSRRQRRA
jgi:prolipoprotein diacylglyceryltransferase